MKKMTWLWILLAIIVAVIGGYYALKPILPSNKNVGNRAKLERTFAAAEQKLINENQLTADELAKHNGENGSKPYVAINGVVYDMSGFPSWVSGRHNGVNAGTDVTEKFVAHGHGTAILQKMPVVGGLKK